MTDKKLDIPAFAGTGFDCEVRCLDGWSIVFLESAVYGKNNEILYLNTSYGTSLLLDTRPRLNKPQVLRQADYLKLPHGFIWNVSHFSDGFIRLTEEVKTAKLKKFTRIDNCKFINHIECIGAEPAYSKGAKRLGIPVIGGEV